MSLRDDLYDLERKLGDGNGDTYREHLADDAVVVVPGQALSKEETAQAMDASPGWDELSFDDERFVQLGDDTALLSYRFSGRRGEDFRYTALMGSLYVRRDGSWKMAFHQQTPLT
jgi:hypothetical protein